MRLIAIKNFNRLTALDIIDLYPLSQYNVIHYCRKDKIGGGVALYVTDHFNFIPREELSNYLESTRAESVFIEIPSCCPFNIKSIIIGCIIIGCIYRPPDSDISTFNGAL